jgi:hypothetical protein
MTDLAETLRRAGLADGGTPQADDDWSAVDASVAAEGVEGRRRERDRERAGEG